MKENMLLTNENETCNKARIFAPISEKMWRKWAPKKQESPNPVLFQTKSSHKEPFAIPKESQYTTNLRPLTHRPRETKREAIQNRCKSVTPSPYPLLTPHSPVASRPSAPRRTIFGLLPHHHIILLLLLSNTSRGNIWSPKSLEDCRRRSSSRFDPPH